MHFVQCCVALVPVLGTLILHSEHQSFIASWCSMAGCFALRACMPCGMVYQSFIANYTLSQSCRKSYLCGFIVGIWGWPWEQLQLRAFLPEAASWGTQHSNESWTAYTGKCNIFHMTSAKVHSASNVETSHCILFLLWELMFGPSLNWVQVPNMKVTNEHDNNVQKFCSLLKKKFCSVCTIQSGTFFTEFKWRGIGWIGIILGDIGELLMTKHFHLLNIWHCHLFILFSNFFPGTKNWPEEKVVERLHILLLQEKIAFLFSQLGSSPSHLEVTDGQEPYLFSCKNILNLSCHHLCTNLCSEILSWLDVFWQRTTWFLMRNEIENCGKPHCTNSTLRFVCLPPVLISSNKQETFWWWGESFQEIYTSNLKFPQTWLDCDDSYGDKCDQHIWVPLQTSCLCCNRVGPADCRFVWRWSIIWPKEPVWDSTWLPSFIWKN